jgi:NAD(P)H-flavin reductase/ferredoxin
MFEALFRRGPVQFTARIQAAEVAFRSSSKETLLQSALNQGIAFPHNCRAGGCGACKCRLVEGKVKELTDKSYLLSADELRDNYILACQSIPKSDVLLAVDLNSGQPQHPLVECQGTILSLDQLTHDILHVKLGIDQPLAYTCGQYAEFVVPAQANATAGSTRSYSFAASPGSGNETNHLEFFIRKVPGGAFTEWLFAHAIPGMALELRGPYGDFYLRPGSDPIVCIAGGSGLAPIKALLELEQQTASKGRDVVLFFGARTQDDLYGITELKRLGSQWPGRFDLIPVLSNELESSDWQGRRGFIHEHISTDLGAQLAQHHAYLCGPPLMIDACVEVLTKGGIDTTHIHFDKFLDQSHLNASTVA